VQLSRFEDSPGRLRLRAGCQFQRIKHGEPSAAEPQPN
jgi:hypothetical protein